MTTLPALPDFDDAAAAAWCTIVGTTGRAVVTNAYTDVPAGSLFVAVLDEDGDRVAHWPQVAWGNPGTAQQTMAAVWSAAAAGRVEVTDDFGTELVFDLAAGQVRACVEGTHVRLVDADGVDLDGGSAFWESTEWQCAPDEVMGAILGAAKSLT